MTPLHEQARAKVNLSLHVLGRRADGYHELESLVVFADICDDLRLQPGGELGLVVDGTTADAAGPLQHNLVLRATRELAERVPGLRVGTFYLTKRLPVAAGLGGGSADAAAALRLLAAHNGIAIDDVRLRAAARSTGADCSVCLASQPAMMRGIGHDLEPLSRWTALAAVLVNPRVAVPTRSVFEALALQPGEIDRGRAHPPLSGLPIEMLATARNDLAPPARSIAHVIIDVEAALSAVGASLVRMSGSGATVFGLFPDSTAASSAAAKIRTMHPDWWIEPVIFGGT